MLYYTRKASITVNIANLPSTWPLRRNASTPRGACSLERYGSSSY